jgi:hypothetical protein
LERDARSVCLSLAILHRKVTTDLGVSKRGPEPRRDDRQEETPEQAGDPARSDLVAVADQWCEPRAHRRNAIQQLAGHQNLGTRLRYTDLTRPSERACPAVRSFVSSPHSPRTRRSSRPSAPPEDCPRPHRSVQGTGNTAGSVGRVSKRRITPHS